MQSSLLMIFVKEPNDNLAFSQSSVITPVLDDVEKLTLKDVIATTTTYLGTDALAVRLDDQSKGGDQPTFVWLNDIDFHNGIIELKVAGSLIENAPPWARGFVGVAFRINENASKFENFYLRPANGKTNDEARRQHATQYFSYPDYDFFRLRKESPEQYESAAEIDLDTWADVKIIVKDSEAKLYVNQMDSPVLTVFRFKTWQ